jgi:hypothetical protein
MTRTRDDQPETAADLSEAARAAVRDSGDPRIDAHLAALGLGPDPTPVMDEAPAPEPVPAPLVAPDPALPAADDIRDRLVSVEADLAATRRRTRVLGGVLAISLIANVVLALLLVSRPG